MKDLTRRYQVFSSEDWDVIGSFDKIDYVIEQLKTLIDNLNEDWILNDMEVCGVSDVGDYEVLDMNYKNGSEHYNMIKNIILESIKQ